MHEDLQNILSHLNKKHIRRQGLHIAHVETPNKGISYAKDVLYEVASKMSLLYLSGGSTPKPLYEQLAQEEKIRPGAVGLIDERYGTPLHHNSNEKMIADTGLLRYFSILDIPYYSVLKGKSIEETSVEYDELIRSLQTVYTTSIGIVGIGKDGHTAGIAPNRSDFTNPLFSQQHAFDMFSWFDDTNGSFAKRVTMTFLALSMLDVLLVLVFGKDKQLALQAMFESGDEEMVPARFFLRPTIASKTLLITDQEIA